MQGCDSQGIPRDILRIGMRDGDTATDWQAGRIDLLPFQQSIQKSLLGHPDSIKFVSHDRQDLIAVGGLDIHTYQIGVQKYAHVVTAFTGSEMAIKYCAVPDQNIRWIAEMMMLGRLYPKNASVTDPET